MNPCKITQDLLPLYVDGTLSEDSQEYVERHLNECEECRNLHTAMKKSVEIVLSRQNAQTSFKAFKRRIFWKKFLLTALCAIVALALLAVVLYNPLDAFLNRPFLMRIEPIKADLYCHNEGWVEMDLCYTEEDVYLQYFDWYAMEDAPETVCISPYYSRMGQINRWWNNTFWDGSYDNKARWLLSFPTELLPNSPAFSELSVPCSRIILKGSDGERVIWEKGDELPGPPWMYGSSASPGATPFPSASQFPESTSRPEASSYPLPTASPIPMPTTFPADTGAAATTVP